MEVAKRGTYLTQVILQAPRSRLTIIINLLQALSKNSLKKDMEFKLTDSCKNQVKNNLALISKRKKSMRILKLM